MMSGLYSKLSRIRSLPLLSRLSPSSSTARSAEDLEGFRGSQGLAYRCATTIAAELKEGWTERQTATLMDTFLRDNGVKTFFHRSFAWFGERTRFDGVKHYFDFLPSHRALAPGEVVILDTAPVLHGYAGDIGFTFSLAPNEALGAARRLLLEFRERIRGAFASDTTTAQIWKNVDEDLRRAGYDNCHQRYPFEVLGHRLHHMPLAAIPGMVAPFTWHSYWALGSRGLFPELLGPWHSGRKPGIWAIEPHLGGKGFGAKFEEILVVEEGKAYWLDDEAPHLHLPKGLY